MYQQQQQQYHHKINEFMIQELKMKICNIKLLFQQQMQ